MDCGLCTAVNEDYRIIERTERAYSMIALTPLVEGHTMVLPRRHTKMEGLTPEELVEMNAMMTRIKDKQVALYPNMHPIIACLSDTQHSSISDHLHYHLIPSEANIRKLMATYDPNIPEHQRADPEELERMATLLRR